MADSMVSLALTKEEIKDRKAEFCSPCAPGKEKGPQFPWGTSLDLNTAVLDKLGLATPKVGSYITVTARCCVQGTSESKRDGSEENRSVSLQIEEMAVSADKPMRGTAKRKAEAAEERAEQKAGKHTARKRGV